MRFRSFTASLFLFLNNTTKFVTMTTPADREAVRETIKSNLMGSPTKIPIIDSHIHLYPASEASTLGWYSTSAPQELQGQHSLDEYETSTGAPSELEGFVFLETDRKFDLEPVDEDYGPGWKFPLMEVDWLRRIATGEPKDGEGHSAAQAKLCKAIIPWAPIPSGPEVLAKYVKAVEETAGAAFSKIRGFRYLVQDKPDGTMLEEKFIDSLKWLGQKGYVFDLGVDIHRRDAIQMVEAVEMIGRVHDGAKDGERTVFIINHLCKPDLTITDDIEQQPAFTAWRENIYTLSKFPSVYMKLSGSFSELSPSMQKRDKEDIFEHMMPWLIVILATFRGRLMFGSDWPVCTAGVGDANGEDEGAWAKWRWIVERLCELAGFTVEEQVMLWSGTAIKAYGIKELM